MRRVLHWLGILLGVLVLLLLIALGGVYALSTYRLNQTYAVPAESLTIPTDAASVEHGKHIATAMAGCGNCHGVTLGGHVVFDQQPLGSVVAPNLTTGKGGIGATFTDADWVRAIRHGVGPNGKALLIMPSDDYHNLGATDLAALIAYLKQLPPADSSDLPTTALGPLGRALFVTGQLPLLPADKIDQRAPLQAPPPAGPTAQYGQYLASFACQGCHGPSYTGGKIPGGDPNDPPAANLTPAGIGAWSETDFVHALRDGQRPDGTRIDTAMPWPVFHNMTDDELRALYLFLRTLPAKGQ
ncbi:MAG: c-type cytochrome [Thermomicrobiales bacterium]